MTFCYINGEIKEKDEAFVSINDIGFLRGFGLYEAMTSFRGKPFKINDHLDRFENGAKFLNIKIPESREDIKGIIAELLRRNSEKESFEQRYNIKFILTGGSIVGGIDYDYEKPTFCILTEKFDGLPEEYFENGIKIITEEYQREFPEIKTTNYIKAVTLQKKIKENNAFEVLYFKDGKILECSTSNIFIVKDNVLITPEDGVLKGITRKTILDISERNNIKIEKRDVLLNELFQSDEVFITASFKEILPVVNVDDKKIKDAKVGKMTLNLINLLNSEIENL